MIQKIKNLIVALLIIGAPFTSSAQEEPAIKLVSQKEIPIEGLKDVECVKMEVNFNGKSLQYYTLKSSKVVLNLVAGELNKLNDDDVLNLFEGFIFNDVEYNFDVSNLFAVDHKIEIKKDQKYLINSKTMNWPDEFPYQFETNQPNGYNLYYAWRLPYKLQEMITFDVDFKGGTLSEFITYLNKQFKNSYQKLPKEVREFLPSEIEVVLKDEAIAKAIRIPPVLARNSNIKTFISDDQNSTDFVFGSFYLDLTTFEKPTSKLQIFWDIKEFVLNNDLKVKTYNIAKILASTDIESFVSLIKATWDANGLPYTDDIRYHEQTKAIIVRVNYEQIESLEEILKQWGLKLETTTSPQATLEDKLEEIVQNLEELNTTLKNTKSNETKSNETKSNETKSNEK